MKDIKGNKNNSMAALIEWMLNNTHYSQNCCGNYDSFYNGY